MRKLVFLIVFISSTLLINAQKFTIKLSVPVDKIQLNRSSNLINSRCMNYNSGISIGGSVLFSKDGVKFNIESVQEQDAKYSNAEQMDKKSKNKL